MKTKLTSFCATLLLATCISATAEEPAAAKKGSAEFERMKTLVGSWQGKSIWARVLLI